MSKEVDVLLMSPKSAAFADQRLRAMQNCLPPIGLAYIASAIREYYKVNILDLGPLDMSKKELINYFEEIKPKIVGITSTVGTYKNGLKIAKMLKQLYPNILIIMGGPQATFLCQETLDTGVVDIVSKFEGENSFLEICNHYLGQSESKLENIKGIAFKKGNEIIETERREFISDLDSLKLPAYDLLNLENYKLNTWININTGRGCPFNCKFCSANFYSGRKYRIRDINKVIDEILFVQNNYNKSKFFIADDTFTFSNKRVQEFCLALKERNVSITWQCEGRVDTVNEELLQTMKDSGCIAIQYGVESGSQDTLKNIDKRTTLEQVYNAVKMAYKIGMNVICSFIIGLPEDKEDNIKATIDFARKLRGIQEVERTNKISTIFSIFTPLPGTYYYENSEELGIKYHTKDWDQFSFMNAVIDTKYLTRFQIQNFYADAMMSTKCNENN
jgi:radical SAM superfamily enzyme YgiQ (UPF0313 family)